MKTLDDIQHINAGDKKISASNFNSMVDVCNMMGEINSDSYGNVTVNKLGIAVFPKQPRGDDWLTSFGRVLFHGNQLKVFAGSIICGNTILAVATATLTLNTSVAYVYAYAKMDLTSAGVNFLPTDPLAMPFEGVEYRWRLWQYTAWAAKVYKLTKIYWRGGDITAYAPLGK